MQKQKDRTQRPTIKFACMLNSRFESDGFFTTLTGCESSSIMEASWSEIPGIEQDDATEFGRLVMMRSRVFLVP